MVVVSGSISAAEVLRLDGLCHASNIGFIRARTHGVFASVFTDFGKGFKVVDVDGEYLARALHITSEPDYSAVCMAHF